MIERFFSSVRDLVSLLAMGFGVFCPSDPGSWGAESLQSRILSNFFLLDLLGMSIFLGWTPGVWVSRGYLDWCCRGRHFLQGYYPVPVY